MQPRTPHWFKSSYSGTSSDCVEAAHIPTEPWHTASYSAERGACVEVAEGPITGVRDTKHRDLGALFFHGNEWQAFLNVAKGDLH
ncbi:DUF397 domain-containing protein [Nocardiopsis sp. YSL2]|uniref:DUF397 domain-containing protein n=1 Tax=Nocardiopsis sp. YSL2 TaxID=2939492 RepID=UPI0026F43951|nr:DUF397 domain-containing protein [Nocardiopsis sp. YSL2]